MSLMELAARLGSTEGYESLSTAAGTPWVAVRLDGEPSPSFHAQPNCPVVGIGEDLSPIDLQGHLSGESAECPGTTGRARQRA